MKALIQGGADVIALSRTQSDLDSLKEEVTLHKNIYLQVVLKPHHHCVAKQQAPLYGGLG